MQKLLFYRFKSMITTTYSKASIYIVHKNNYDDHGNETTKLIILDDQEHDFINTNLAFSINHER